MRTRVLSHAEKRAARRSKNGKAEEKAKMYDRRCRITQSGWSRQEAESVRMRFSDKKYALHRKCILARAKRERVVQDGVEKANRRPDRHGTAPLAPYLKFDHFWRNSLFENEQFSTKIGEIGAHSLFENWQFPTKFRENWWNWGALLIWKLTIFDEN